MKATVELTLEQWDKLLDLASNGIEGCQDLRIYNKKFILDIDRQIEPVRRSNQGRKNTFKK